MEKIKLVIMCGGQSSEEKISRLSATSVLKNIDMTKYELTLVGIDLDGRFYKLDNTCDLNSQGWLEEGEKIGDIVDFLKNNDVVWPVLHGLYGEDGTIQGLFELAGIKYVGCQVLASAVAMDKIYTKKILDSASIPQTPSLYVKKLQSGKLVVVDDDFNYLDDVEGVITEKLGMPCFVKASRQGSSVGCYKVNDKSELMAKLTMAGEFDNKIVVEKAVNCIELEVGVMGNDELVVSPVGQVMPHGEFYTFESKYEDSESKTVIPALVDESIQEIIRDLALKAYRAIDGAGYSRIDFFLDRDSNNIYLNEINTLPGFTNISMFPMLMEAAGYKYPQLIDKLIEYGMEI